MQTTHSISKTEAARFSEEVRGTIIGECDSCRRGQLFLDGRPQSRDFMGETDLDIRNQALAYIETLKSRLGMTEYKRLYPSGMELRIWD